MNITRKIAIILICLIFIGTAFIFLATRNNGKTRIKIEAIPSDSTIYINNNRITKSEVYLKPGKYTFKATKTGFVDDSVTLTITQQNETVSLLPSPNSEAAYNWIKDNPDIQIDREAIGGEMSQRKGEEVARQDPIIKALPYDDLVGPFSIDYGASKKRPNGIFLDISNSSPQGRENAMKWIKSQGYDVTDLEIVFRDYNQQLFPREVNNAQ